MEDTMLAYLRALEANNNREWYHEHKEAYKEAYENFEELVQWMMLEVAPLIPEIMHYHPEELTFRVARDMRFHRGKLPYNPSFRAHFGPRGKHSIPVGFYVSLKPDNRSILGAGLFTPSFREATLLIREAIANQPERFEAIVQDPEFSKYFTLAGDTLKNVPKEYPSDHPMGEYLKYKSWYITVSVEDALVMSVEEFLGFAKHMFRLMKPFNDFLNDALQSFEMPQRRR